MTITIVASSFVWLAVSREFRNTNQSTSDEFSFGAQDDSSGEQSHTRSTKWPKVRATHLLNHGECIACGGTENLNVHHIVSFSVDPSRELSPENLCTLCTKSRFNLNCHFVFGHNLSWKCRNPEVVEDAIHFREMLNRRLCDEPKSTSTKHSTPTKINPVTDPLFKKNSTLRQENFPWTALIPTALSM